MGEHHDILNNIYPEGCTGSVRSMYVYIYNVSNITFLNVGYKIYCNMYSNLCDKLHIFPFITCNFIFKDVHVHVLCINYKAHCVVSKVIFT